MFDKVGLLGDLHGSLPWAKFALKAFHSLGIRKVIQVGDFGLYVDKSSQSYLDIVNFVCDKLDMELYVVPGNHENWEYINTVIGDSPTWVNFRSRIFVAPRVNHWTWQGVKFASLSGAPSVDRTWRVEWDGSLHPSFKGDRAWYAEEAITEDDVATISVLEGSGIDVMIGHDAPEGVPTIDLNIGHNPHGFALSDLTYAAHGRRLVTQAFDAVAPKVYAHGHYHFRVKDYIDRPGHPGDKSLIFGLGADTFPDSLGYIELETLRTEHINHDKMLQEYRNGTL